jgi:demethylmenaquinone methyltransferase/2-methoxy-6-polyprenyl-1,4-benzoquinol methylase
MFARIATHYDLMNRLMSAGQDRRWRRRVVDLAHLRPGARLLDIGAGTGDLALEAQRRNGRMTAVAGDVTIEMMREGRARTGGRLVQWVNTDALDLPFPAGSFDAVTSGYLMRNVIDVRRAWAEQYRVLKGGGNAVCLDTTPPPRDVWHILVRLYLQVVIPALGRLVARDREAYGYLADSTRRFVGAEELALRMREAGFKEVQFQRMVCGTMAIHWGHK